MKKKIKMKSEIVLVELHSRPIDKITCLLIPNYHVHRNVGGLVQYRFSVEALFECLVKKFVLCASCLTTHSETWCE